MKALGFNLAVFGTIAAVYALRLFVYSPSIANAAGIALGLVIIFGGIAVMRKAKL